MFLISSGSIVAAPPVPPPAPPAFNFLMFSLTSSSSNIPTLLLRSSLVAKFLSSALVNMLSSLGAPVIDAHGMVVGYCSEELEAQCTRPHGFALGVVPRLHWSRKYRTSKHH